MSRTTSVADRLEFWTVKATMMQAMNLHFRPRPGLHNFILG